MGDLIPFAMDIWGLAQSAGRAAINHYLGRPKRGGRRRRGGGRRRATPRGTPAQVPQRTIMQGTFSGTIRQFYTVKTSNSNYYRQFPLTSLLADAYVSLRTQFAEAQVKSIRVYFTPTVPITTAGSYAAAFIDGDHLAAANKAQDYDIVLSMPNSVVRRIYQPAGMHWKWTEPSDAEFMPTTSADIIAALYISTPTGGDSIAGEVTLDASIVLRSPGHLLGHPLLRMLKEVKWPESVLVEALDLLTANLETTDETDDPREATVDGLGGAIGKLYLQDSSGR